MKAEQIKRGAEVTIPKNIAEAGKVWKIVGAELSEMRGLLLLRLEREEQGQTYRSEEFAKDCELA